MFKHLNHLKNKGFALEKLVFKVLSTIAIDESLGVPFIIAIDGLDE